MRFRHYLLSLVLATMVISLVGFGFIGAYLWGIPLLLHDAEKSKVASDEDAAARWDRPAIAPTLPFDSHPLPPSSTVLAKIPGKESEKDSMRSGRTSEAVSSKPPTRRGVIEDVSSVSEPKVPHGKWRTDDAESDSEKTTSRHKPSPELETRKTVPKSTVAEPIKFEKIPPKKATPVSTVTVSTEEPSISSKHDPVTDTTIKESKHVPIKSDSTKSTTKVDTESKPPKGDVFKSTSGEVETPTESTKKSPEVIKKLDDKSKSTKPTTKSEIEATTSTTTSKPPTSTPTKDATAATVPELKITEPSKSSGKAEVKLTPHPPIEPATKPAEKASKSVSIDTTTPKVKIVPSLPDTKESKTEGAATAKKDPKSIKTDTSKPKVDVAKTPSHSDTKESKTGGAATAKKDPKAAKTDTAKPKVETTKKPTSAPKAVTKETKPSKSREKREAQWTPEEVVINGTLETPSIREDRTLSLYPSLPKVDETTSSIETMYASRYPPSAPVFEDIIESTDESNNDTVVSTTKFPKNLAEEMMARIHSIESHLGARPTTTPIDGVD